jgi:hypothetical protein
MARSAIRNLDVLVIWKPISVQRFFRDIIYPPGSVIATQLGVRPLRNMCSRGPRWIFRARMTARGHGGEARGCDQD